MNKRLDNAIEAARRTLSEHAQEDLAALVEEFVTGQTLESETAVTAGQEGRLEQRLDATHPVADPAAHDRWFREKVETAVREADADPDRRASLSEMQMKFGLGG